MIGRDDEARPAGRDAARVGHPGDLRDRLRGSGQGRIVERDLGGRRHERRFEERPEAGQAIAEHRAAQLGESGANGRRSGGVDRSEHGRRRQRRRHDGHAGGDEGAADERDGECGSDEAHHATENAFGHAQFYPVDAPTQHPPDRSADQGPEHQHRETRRDDGEATPGRVDHRLVDERHHPVRRDRTDREAREQTEAREKAAAHAHEGCHDEKQHEHHIDHDHRPPPPATVDARADTKLSVCPSGRDDSKMGV